MSRWAPWLCRLAAIGCGLLVAACHAIATAGFHQQDERGFVIGPTRAESMTTLIIAVGVPLLLILSLEVSRRCSRRTTARWLSSLALWTFVVLYVGVDSWHGTATTGGVAAIVAAAVAATVGIIVVTRGLKSTIDERAR